MCGLAAAAAGALAATPEQLARMSLEELANIEITSVSKRAEPLREAAAAVFVITGDDIRRAGVTSIPEALRLAPNLQVARIDSSQYAISARGFNTSTSNKLLVLIDGRSVYTPLYSGVFWDVQDTLLPDIERIEVISGPGGTLWGSNAVNGVINIITRDARATQGGLVHMRAGSDERLGAARYGGRFGEGGGFRVYAKGNDRDATRTGRHDSARDSWDKQQVGFRVDGGVAGNNYMLQGEAYTGSIEQRVGDDKEVSGSHLLGRWERTLADRSHLQVQFYYDRTWREYPGLFEETLDTYDIDLQHQFTLTENQTIIWGGGYRLQRDDVDSGAGLAFMPAQRTLSWSNIFVQDELAFSEQLRFTLGAKLEHNHYSGSEFQPNARLALHLSDRSLLWSAVSRAVRTPSRVDRDLFIPGAPPYLLAGGPEFESERLTAYEIGYRVQPSEAISLSISTFFNDYDDLRTLERANAFSPYQIRNRMHGETYGAEIWGSYQVNANWRLSAGYNRLVKRLSLKSDSVNPNGVRTEGNDPPQQFSLRSAHNLPRNLEFDAIVRAVDRLPDPKVPGYVMLDARLGWKALKGVELSLTGSNLLDHRHPEFGSEPNYSEFRRALIAGVLWTF